MASMIQRALGRAKFIYNNSARAYVFYEEDEKTGSTHVEVVRLIGANIDRHGVDLNMDVILAECERALDEQMKDGCI